MPLALCIVGCGQFAPDFAHSPQPVRDEVDLSFASGTHGPVPMQRCSRAAGRLALCRRRGRPPVEALYPCTPHHLHQAHVAPAAQAGKHILVEKPSPAPWLKAAR